MSKAELITEIRKLTPQERAEIRDMLDELDGERWLDGGELSPDQRQLLENRLEVLEKDSEAGSPWEEVKARIHAKLRS